MGGSAFARDATYSGPGEGKVRTETNGGVGLVRIRKLRGPLLPLRRRVCVKHNMGLNSRFERVARVWELITAKEKD